MKIVVTGHAGQVASCLAQEAADERDIEMVFLRRPDFDLLDSSSVDEQICKHSPDVVVSAAAYTAVDMAEDEEDVAYAINAVGAEAVALAAKKCGAPIIHLSTDYVFDGTKEGAYVETDTPNPQTAYGRTKLAGEKFVARANPEHIILRTAWVYSPFGKNFVKTMLRLAEEKNEVGVVNDQFGNPTSACEIAKAIVAVSKQISSGGFDAYGTYHFAGPETMNWAEFARAVFKYSEALGGPSCEVKDIDTPQFPTKAMRPKNSGLDSGRLLGAFNFDTQSVVSSLEEVVCELADTLPKNADNCTLSELYSRHTGKVSDKWRSYFEHYDAVLGRFRGQHSNMLEIGVQNGGSLEIWKKFLGEHSTIVGCDINQLCGELDFVDSNTHIVVGDACDAATADKVVKQSDRKAFDIVVDDGSHNSRDIVLAFCNYFQLLRAGGVYCIEDLHCSFWRSHDGGLNNPLSALSFFASLIGFVNHDHWETQDSFSFSFEHFRQEWSLDIQLDLLKTIQEIRFVNSMCFVIKNEVGFSGLGPRVISGSHATVVPEILELK